MSGVPQGNDLGHLLFSLHTNDIMSDIESEIRLFADDCVCFREIKNKEDTLKLRKNIYRLVIWARKCGVRFQPVKCNMMQLTKKTLKKSGFLYPRGYSSLKCLKHQLPWCNNY